MQNKLTPAYGTKNLMGAENALLPNQYYQTFVGKTLICLLKVIVKSIVIGALLFTRAIAQQQHIDVPNSQLAYHFSWTGKTSIMGIDLYYNASVKDSTVFIYGDPDEGGQSTIFQVIGKVSTGPGDTFTIRQADRKIIITHKTSGLKKLHYEIDGKVIIDAKRARPNELLRPVIAPNSLYIVGFNLFMHADTAIYKTLSFVWDNSPAGMPYFISIAPLDKAGIKQTIPIANKNKVLIIMDKDLIIKKYIVYGAPYYVVTSNRDPAYDMQKALTPFFTKFFPSTRDFWQDYNTNYYFLCLLPLFNDVPSTSTGYSLGNGFIMKYSGPLDVAKELVVAHETSHTWIGTNANSLSLKESGMENNWFMEGFNDYIAVYNLARTGMLDKTQFLKYVNDDNLRRHYTSPVNTAPGDSIEKYFWVNHDYEKIPYNRGFIYAFYLDNQIRLASGGQKNIRHFLLAFLQGKQRAQKQELTSADFAEAASAFLPKDQVVSEIDHNMINGKLLDFNHIKLISDFQINYVNNIPVLALAPGADLQKIYSW